MSTIWRNEKETRRQRFGSRSQIENEAGAERVTSHNKPITKRTTKITFRDGRSFT